MMPMMQTRRRFLTALSAVSAAGLVRAPPALSAEGPLETNTLRLENPALCVASLYVAEELLRAEGFTDIRYVVVPPSTTEAVARGEVDFGPFYASQCVEAIDAGEPITVLAGVMVGCFELFANESIRSIADLKGRSVGKIDAFLGFPPESQDLRARRIGHVVVNSTVDRPWSQYFCCMLAGNREFVATHPVATKRVLRAVLKATELCAAEPARIAQEIVDGGFTARYDYALQTLREIPYDRWREYDAEDTIRFYALRLREVGLIKSTPQQIITEGTNWRFFEEVKRELKT